MLAPHGFTPDEARVRDRSARTSGCARPQPESTIFGDVLDAAARAADGDVILKMDDDDWYSPDAIADLLRARAYSGAELVGMPAEFHYLEERDLTVRRGHPTELYATFVAGGTMMVDRSMLREVGGFRPVRKYVDAQLLAAVRPPAARSTAPTASATCSVVRRRATPGRSTSTTCSTRSGSRDVRRLPAEPADEL